MSALNNLDLIDLSEKNCTIDDDEVFAIENVPNKKQSFIPEFQNSRSSLDNNPFDKVQRLANSNDDPFEIVEKNIYLNRLSNNSYSNVKTENLISICDNGDDKNIHKDGKFDSSANSTDYLSVQRFRTANSTTSISPIQSPTSDIAVDESNKTLNAGFCADSTGFASDNSAMASEFNKGFILDSLSSLQNSSDNNCVSDIKGSCLKRSSSSTDFNISSLEKRQNSKLAHNKLRTGSLDINSPRVLNCMRNQLLKLSLSNSSLNSPAKRSDDKSADNSIFLEARTLAENILHLGVNDTSANDDSCDDLMSIKPNWIGLDSESDLDNDLEQLNIPFLQEMAKGENKIDQDLNKTVIREQLLKDLKHHKDTNKVIASAGMVIQNNEIENTEENSDIVEKLIDNLKNSLESYDEEKKDRANSLLETLSSVLNKREVISPKSSESSVPAPPTPIVRQGTFDLDIHNTDESTQNTPSMSLNNETDLKNRGPDLSPEMNNIVEQIEKILVNQSVNVYEANLGASNNLMSNPTFVVVMNTPISMEKQKSNAGTFREPALIEMRSRRSQSVSIHDKPNTSGARYRQSTYSESPSVYGTPIRSRVSNRRYSVSETPPPLPINARRSIYGIQNKEISKTNISQRRSLAPSASKVAPKKLPTIKLDTIPKTFKVKNNDHMTKLKGPLKATIPIKKVAPMIVTPSISSPIECDEKGKPITSTPITNIRGRPSACSTPAQNGRVLVSPIPNSTIKPKSRHSYLSVTPNSKLQSNSTSIYNNRRTKSASKSPINSLDTMTGRGKPETKMSQELPKKSISLRKFSPMNPIVNRKVNARVTTEKNKENHIPK